MKISFEQRMITCPNKVCQTPFYPTYNEMFIFYPEDEKKIFDLVEWKFNVNECPLCKGKVFLKNDFLIINKTAQKVLAYVETQKTKQEIGELVGETLDVVFTKDIFESRKLMMKWMYTSIGEIFEAVSKQQHKTYHIVVTRFQLRLLFAVLNGYITATIRDIDGNQIDIPATYTNIVIQLVNSLSEDCLSEKNLLLLPDKIASLIPSECITDPIMQAFLQAVETVPKPETFSGLAQVFAVEYIYSVLCFHAGNVNSRKEYFTELVFAIWEIHFRAPLVGMNRQMVLNRKIGQNLLSFTYLFDLSLNVNKNAENTSKDLWKTRMIMKFYGWSEEFFTALAERIKVRTTDDKKPDYLANYFLDAIAQRVQFNQGYITHEAIAGIFSAQLNVVLSMAEVSVAQKFVIIFLEKAEEADDWGACINVCVQSIKGFNKARDFTFSKYLADLITERYGDYIESLSDEHFFDFLIEYGNVFRYTGEYKAALETYDQARQLNLTRMVHASPELRQEAVTVLKRNMAIVHRELRNFAQSERLLKELLQQEPNNLGITMNLVMLYFQVNDYTSILSLLGPFNNLLSVPMKEQVMSYMMQAIAHSRLGSFSEAKRLLNLSFKETKLLNAVEICQLLISALIVYRDSEDEGAFTTEETALVYLKSRSIENEQLESTLGVYLLKRYLLTGEIDKASSLVSLMEWEDGLEQSAWEYQFYLCWYFFEAGKDELSLAHAKRLIIEIHEVLPSGENSKFAITWMSDKGELQLQMLDIMHQLFLRGLVSEVELLSIIEFSYGKELSIKLTRDEPQPEIKSLLEAVATKFGKSIIIGFFETKDGVQFYSLDNEKARILISDVPLISLKEAEEINVRTRSAFRDACPGLMEETDKKLNSFRALLEKFSATFESLLMEEIERIIFVPGKSLANLPLHLLRWKGKTIAEQFPIIYVPNLSTLVLIKGGQNKEKSVLLVTVTRRDEGGQFKKSTEEVAAVVTKYLRLSANKVISLVGQEATIASVKQQLPQVDEAIFLCHGASGRNEDGKGICLSYAGNLPPSLLPVNDIPHLKGFLLSWRDLEDLPQAPALIVSLACSTGTTVFGKGGTTFGLEQSLFMAGTTAILSPLWDVEHESAVYWLRAFYIFRHENPGATIERAFLEAVRQTKQLFPHEYYWAPFILKGNK